MIHVTGVIGNFNPSVEFMDDEYALDFGRAVHLVCEYEDQGDLDMGEVDEPLIPYLLSWRDFKNDFKPEFLHIEQSLKNILYQGTPDRYAEIINQKTKKREMILVSIKTGGFQKGPCGLQESAYANLLDWKIDRALVVMLDDKGYKIGHDYSKYELKRYYSIFLSMLNTYNFIDNGFKL